jgi:hypothetical protein
VYSTRASIHVDASPAGVYRLLLDPEAIIRAAKVAESR